MLTFPQHALLMIWPTEALHKLGLNFKVYLFWFQVLASTHFSLYMALMPSALVIE